MKTFNKFSYLDIDSSVIKLENQVKVWQNSIDENIKTIKGMKKAKKIMK